MSRILVVLVGLVAIAVGVLAGVSAPEARVVGFVVGAIGLTILLVGLKTRYLGSCPVCGGISVALAQRTEGAFVRHRCCRECGARWVPTVRKTNAVLGLFVIAVILIGQGGVLFDAWDRGRIAEGTLTVAFIVGAACLCGIIYYLRVLFAKGGRLRILDEGEHRERC